MTQVLGTCSEPFQQVRSALEENLVSGEELGASFAVDVDGETVVDLWGGWRRRRAARALERGHHRQRLVDHQDDDAPRRACCWPTGASSTSTAGRHAYWPEFAASGKEAIEVATCCPHLRRLRLDAPFAVEDLYDWEKSTAGSPPQAPWWEPGTASGYHALNQGHLVGEVVRRITGSRLSAFVAEEIAGRSAPTSRSARAEDDWPRSPTSSRRPPLPRRPQRHRPGQPAVKTFTGPAGRRHDGRTRRLGGGRYRRRQRPRQRPLGRPRASVDDARRRGRRRRLLVARGRST